MIAHNPLHRSGRAAFPHPALASGEDGWAAQGIRGIDTSGREPAADETPHAVPGASTILATSRKRTFPEPTHLDPEYMQCGAIHGHPKITHVPANDRT